MRTFDFQRDADHTGASGTGLVAQGVEFDDGTVVMRWLTEHRSTCVYPDATTLETIHGHEGDSRIVWHRPELAPDAPGDGPTQFARARALIGQRVRVYLGRPPNDVGLIDSPPTIATGRLLGIAEGGDFEIEDDDGMVRYCWPMLEIEPWVRSAL